MMILKKGRFLIDEFVISKTGKLFSVLSSEIRINIIYHLMENKSLTVTELSEKLDIQAKYIVFTSQDSI